VKTQAVTVIGLGRMGQAMASAFLDNGHRTTVWNRTARRADEAVSKGATRAASAGEALAASELIVLSLTDYDAMYEVLDPVSDALSGRVVVNLSSGTPEQARAAARWVGGCGARYVTGGVRVPPSGIGLPDSLTFYSGPADLFEAHQGTLRALTGTDYRGADPGLAMVHYQFEEDLLWTTMLGYLHALAVADANGISARELVPSATRTMSAVQDLIAFFSPRIDADRHPGDVDRLATGMASVEHIVRATEDAGIDATLPAALREIFRRGMANGHADESATSLVGVFKHPGRGRQEPPGRPATSAM
jgi:3-hydroxyisobutyrate dehydrogenase-like beta-hydroxyacid dehydrogenase